jgi:hypothetical protein
MMIMIQCKLKGSTTPTHIPLPWPSVTPAYTHSCKFTVRLRMLRAYNVSIMTHALTYLPDKQENGLFQNDVKRAQNCQFLVTRFHDHRDNDQVMP